jgi:hypothetical protein
VGIQAGLILRRPERRKRLADQYTKTANQPLNDSHLMLARALWLPNSKIWTEFILTLVSHGRRPVSAVAVSKGSGSTNDAASFACKALDRRDPHMPISWTCKRFPQIWVSVKDAVAANC